MDIQLHSLSDGAVTGSVALADEVFNRQFNEPLIHQVVTAYLAGARQGSKAQKTRAEVRGGGAKPWRQKGLGRARAGTTRGPLWRGGGRAFAARPRDYAQKVNRKMYRGALCSILSELIRQGRLLVVETLAIDEPKTGKLAAMLGRLGLTDVLIVTDEVSEALYLAARNLHWVGLIDTSGVDPALLVSFGKVLVSQPALAKLEEGLK